MSDAAASFRPDGSCRLLDELNGTERIWVSVEECAREWLAEWRSNEHGDASNFIQAATDGAVPGVVDALISLAEIAVGDEISWVGAGPLEDLLSHSGNGLQVLQELDRAARQNVSFRAALACVWLASDVPTPVRERLSVLGAQLLDAS